MCEPTIENELDEHEEAEIYRHFVEAIIIEAIKCAKAHKIVYRKKACEFYPCSPQDRYESREFLTKPSYELGVFLDALDVDMDLFLGWMRKCAADGWPIYGGEDYYSNADRSEKIRFTLIMKEYSKQ